MRTFLYLHSGCCLNYISEYQLDDGVYGGVPVFGQGSYWRGTDGNESVFLNPSAGTSRLQSLAQCH